MAGIDLSGALFAHRPRLLCARFSGRPPPVGLVTQALCLAASVPLPSIRPGNLRPGLFASAGKPASKTSCAIGELGAGVQQFGCLPVDRHQYRGRIPAWTALLINRPIFLLRIVGMSFPGAQMRLVVALEEHLICISGQLGRAARASSAAISLRFTGGAGCRYSDNRTGSAASAFGFAPLSFGSG